MVVLDAGRALVDARCADAGPNTVTISVRDAAEIRRRQTSTIVVAGTAATTPPFEGVVVCRQGAFVIGPKPYLCSTAPYSTSIASASNSYLETFEDGALDTPGVQSVYATKPTSPRR